MVLKVGVLRWEDTKVLRCEVVIWKEDLLANIATLVQWNRDEEFPIHYLEVDATQETNEVVYLKQNCFFEAVFSQSTFPTK